MPTSLRAIATKARERKDLRFFNLYRLIDENFLLECWRDIRKNAACGVDGISARQYEENLMDNIRNLVERLKRKNYRARLVRRHWIAKPDGRQRPLGIPVVEDKLLQLAVTRILEAIYEPDFLRCSYGYRPNSGALDAVDKLTVKLQFGEYHFVVEADIQGCFDNLDQDLLVEMLSRRIGDRELLRLIRKWFKAGVLDTDGQVMHPLTGTPQGRIVSPILANVYLHRLKNSSMRRWGLCGSGSIAGASAAASRERVSTICWGISMCHVLGFFAGAVLDYSASFSLPRSDAETSVGRTRWLAK